MSIQTVVIKVGTAIITNKSDSLNNAFIKRLVDEITILMKKGIRVLLVSSGAVASGRHELKDTKIKEEKGNVAHKQMFSAVGQGQLLNNYYKLFNKNKIKVAQVLLSDSDFNDRTRYLNVRKTLSSLIKNRIVPIINENDVTSTQELTVGDNDFLGAYVALMTKADLFLILTDVDGLCTDNPKTNKDAVLISNVPDINAHIKSLAKKNTQESRGLGGMTSKIEAAFLATSGGVPTIITNGNKYGNLTDIVINRDLKIGTYFSSQKKKIKSRKSWLSSKIKKNARIYIDKGAEEALRIKGRSLLPAGILKVEGRFERADVVEVWYKSKRIGFGQVNYDSRNLIKIVGKRSSDIKNILPQYFGEEVIHRDDFVLV